MWEVLSKLGDLSKVPTRVLATVCIIAGLLVLSPTGWLENLNLAWLRVAYGPTLSLTFLTLSIFLGLSSGIHLYRVIARLRARAKAHEKLLEELENCDRNELGVLREFVLLRRNTIALPVEQPVIAGLVGKRVLIRAGGNPHMAILGPMFPLRINPSVVEHVTPEFLGITGEMTQEQLGLFFHSNRPEFMLDVHAANKRLFEPGLY
jgi:hypothetical protein